MIGVSFEDDPDAGYTTLGGLIFSQLTQIPEDGNTPEVVTDTLRIQVEQILNHRVEWALVSKLPSAEPESEEDGDKSKMEKSARAERGEKGEKKGKS